VSWIERTGQGVQLQLRRFAANGTAAAPMNVSGTTAPRSGGFPKLALSGNDIVVAWMDGAEPTHVHTAVVNF